MHVPTTLTTRPQWVLWRAERGTKVPYSARGGHASSTDPATWTTYAEACAALNDSYAGLGYVFSGDDGLVGVDLDDCRDPATGELAPWALEILGALSTYAEVSPSGTGVKAWARGVLPRAVKTAGVEVYPRARYFAVTGLRLPEYPAEPQAAQAALDALVERFAPQPEPPLAEQRGPTPSSPAPEWARRKLATAITMITTAAEGEKHNELLDASILAGGLVGHLSRFEIESALEAAIKSRPTVKDWRGAMKTIRDGLHLGEARPLDPPTPPPALVWRGGRPYCPDCGQAVMRSKFHDGLYCSGHDPSYNWRGLDAAQPKAPADAPPAPVYVVDWRGDGLTLAELQYREMPPEVWIVEGILPAGACLLAAKPKAKKSWLALAAGLAVSMDRRFMGRFGVQPGRVLYLDLEGTQRRIKKRTRAMLGVQRVQWPDNFHIFTEWPQGPDALARLEDWLRAHRDTRLVVIDVLASFRRPMEPKEPFYQYDRETVKPINDLLEQYDCAGLLVHHLNKARVEDVFESISGSTGLVSVTNTQWVMGRSPEDRALTIFSMQGRDLEQDEPLALRWNDYGHQHEVEGSAAEVAISVERKAVLGALDDDEPRTPKEIAEILSKPVNAVKQLLTKMLNDGQVDKAGYGKWVKVRGLGNSGNSGNGDNSGNSGNSSGTKVTQELSQLPESYRELPGGGNSFAGHQDAINSPIESKSYRSYRDSLETLLAPVPENLRAYLTAYLQGNRPIDEQMGRDLCIQFGVNYRAARLAARGE